MSSDMEMSDLMGVFLEEAEEQLQKLDDGILQLEKDPSNLEIIKEIFRAAHTLKGSSATMGLKDVADLTHAMENLLDCLRNATAEVTPDIIDLLLESIDSLRVLISQVSAGEPMDLDTTELVQNLRAACSSDSSQVQKVDKKAATPAKNAPVSVASDCMLIRLKIRDDCVMPGVRAFMVYHALTDLGEIISSDPPQETAESIEAGAEMTIVLRPSGSRDEVTQAMRAVSEVDLIEVPDSPAQSPESAAAPVQVKPEAKPAVRRPDNSSEAGSKSIQTVRVGVDRLDTLMNLVAELVIDRTRVTQIEGNLSLKYENEDLVQNLAETAAHIGRVVTELQEHIMKVRLLPVEQVFNRFPRMVRDLTRKAGKEIEFIMEGQETELDRSILEDIVDPLTHLLRNAVDHGVENPEERVKAGKPKTARVVLAAKQEENRIIIEVEDDGNGIDVEKVKAAALKKGAITQDMLSRMSEEDSLQLIFASGVSTAEKITDISGRGVGMDVVRNNIQALSGTVDVHTEIGVGTRFKISLPLTLAIIQALVTGVDDRIFVIPLSAVAETFRCSANDVRSIEGRPAINFRGSVLPLVHLGGLLEASVRFRRPEGDSITFVVVRTGVHKVGLVVDKLIGEQEVVIKPLGSFFGDIRGIAGATILGDGRVALIVDPAGIGALLNRRRFDRSSITAEVQAC